MPILDRRLADLDEAVGRAAAISLLSFDPQVAAPILKTHLQDKQYSVAFTNSLAEADPAAYRDDLVAILKANPGPETTLTGQVPTYTAWDILMTYVTTVDAADLRAGKFDAYLEALESPPNIGSSPYQTLYRFYHDQGLTAPVNPSERRPAHRSPVTTSTFTSSKSTAGNEGRHRKPSGRQEPVTPTAEAHPAFPLGAAAQAIGISLSMFSGGPNLVDRGQYFVGRGSGEEALFSHEAAHGAVTVHEKGGRCIRVAAARGLSRMDHLHRAGDLLIEVRHDDQVRTFSLRGLGCPLVIVGNDDNANAPPGEVRVALFELTQLDPADPSPPAAEEDHRHALTCRQVRVGKGTAIRKRGGEFRHLPPRLSGAGIHWRLRENQQERPLQAAQQDEECKTGALPDAAPLCDRNGHRQDASGRQTGHVPRRSQVLRLQPDEIEDRTGQEQQAANQEQRPPPQNDLCL